MLTLMDIFPLQLLHSKQGGNVMRTQFKKEYGGARFELKTSGVIPG